MANWVLGDVHGQYTALMQVLERSSFNYETDTLIFLGDVVDRGYEPFLCIQELLKIQQKVLIKGNHDLNFLNYILNGVDEFYGRNGVFVTIEKWKFSSEEIRQLARKFFNEQVSFYKIGNTRFFTHGGFDRSMFIKDQPEEVFAWDRSLWQYALMCKQEKLATKDNFTAIYIGHTPTLMEGSTKPMFRAGVWNIDTGAGFSGGKLTLMNVDTNEYVQSDRISMIDYK